MEITRIQPFPLTLNQGELEADTDYYVAILDDHAADLYSLVTTSDSEGEISVELPSYFSRYDAEYRLEIYLDLGENEDGTHELGDLVLVDTLTIMRPYVDPYLLAETPEDIEEAKMYEAVARAIINSITGGFLYERQTVETVGLNNDYLAIPFRLNKVVSVIENDVVVFDAENTDPEWKNSREYYITPDRGSISVVVPGTTGYNRIQSNNEKRVRAASDSFTLYNTNDSPNFSDGMTYSTKLFVDGAGGSPMFPNGWDYVVTVEAGWPIIPQDIKQATTLIVNDLRCNNIPYINSYIKEYNSDQFTLKFDDGVFKDTGNRIADKILSSYVRPIYRLGVL
jgi:hypothetical protein